MSSAHRNDRRNQLKRITVESLERRELMAADALAAYPTWQSARFWAEVALTEQRIQHAMPSFGELKQFQSKVEIENFVVDHLVAKWENYLGKQLDKGFVDSNIKNREYIFHVAPDVEASTSDIMPGASSLQSGQALESINAETFQLAKDGFLYSRGGVEESSKIVIYDARDPSNLRRVATIDSQLASAFHLVDNQLVVVSRLGSNDSRDAFIPSAEESAVTIYDVTNPSNPQFRSSYKIDGAYNFSRIDGDRLTMVLLNYRLVPEPLFIANDLNATYATINDSIGRFETAAEYANRIRPFVLDWLSNDIETDKNGVTTKFESAQWDDIVLRENQNLNQSTVVVSFQMQPEGQLKLIDSELLVGVESQYQYASANSVYLTRNLPFAEYTQETKAHTEITSIDLNADSVVLSGVNSVEGNTYFQNAMDEKDGYLRVFSESFRLVPVEHFADFPYYKHIQTTNLTVFAKDANRSLDVVAELSGLAEDMKAYAIYFNGDSAVLATNFSDTRVPRLNSKILAIDLSDPLHPVAQSMDETTEFFTYFQKIDKSHIVGIGYFPGIEDTYHQLIGLYDVSDPLNWKRIDQWVSPWTFTISYSWQGVDPKSLEYDATTGTLIVPFAELARSYQSIDKDATSLPIFRIDLQGVDRLRVIGYAGNLNTRNATLVDNTLLTWSFESVSSSALGSSAADNNVAKTAIDNATVATKSDMPNQLAQPVSTQTATTPAPATSETVPDINSDGEVTPMDVYMLVQRMGQTGSSAPGMDVTGDGELTPQDVLFVINYLHSRSQSVAANGEGPITNIDSSSDVVSVLACDHEELLKKSRTTNRLAT